MRWQSWAKVALHRGTPWPIRKAQQDAEDLKALARLEPLLPNDFLPWTASAMRPRAIEIIANEVLIHERRRVLECGSGVSTVLLGALLSSVGGSLVSLEDNAAWGDLVRARTAEIESVQVLDVGLTLGDEPWYDVEPARLEALGPFDLIVVDGPISKNRPLARHPVLKHVAPFLAEDFTIVLDDIGRRDERRVVARWLREHDLVESLYFNEGGIAVLRPRGGQFFTVH